MIDFGWTPDRATSISRTWESIQAKAKSNMTVDEAIGLQLEFAAFASEITPLVANARMYEKRKVAEAKRAFHTALLLSKEGSDRKKDADAKNATAVRIAEGVADEAEIYRKLLEDMKDDAVRYHYAAKAVMKDSKEENRIWGG